MSISISSGYSSPAYFPSFSSDQKTEKKEYSTKKNANELSPDEKKEKAELQKRDAEVRSHEAAHASAGGQYVRGGASYEYTTGPDGQRYAVGGEVSIDSSPVKGDPEATIQKMRVVRQAAMAPANPSGQDQAVAAQAAAAEANAQQEKVTQKKEEKKEDDKKTEDKISPLTGKNSSNVPSLHNEESPEILNSAQSKMQKSIKAYTNAFNISNLIATA